MRSFSPSGWMAIWQGRGALACLLWPLSLLFRLVVRIRQGAYRAGIFRSWKLPVPVVVVGNIFIGGTGKTPMVIWLVEALKRAGFCPGVISRGYGSASRRPQAVFLHSRPSDVGDEPLLIRHLAACPMVVGRSRVEAAQLLLAQYPEVDIIVSDDGLQHYALRRDIEVVLFDGRGAGNGWMLPAGPLREPLSRRRDFTVVNSMNYPAPGNLIYSPDIFLMQLRGDEAYRLADRADALPLSELSARARLEGQRVAAMAGIGNPARFFFMLKAWFPEMAAYSLPDHFDFAANPFENVQADMVLITEKDAVKCVHLEAIAQDRRIWVVPAKAQLDDGLEEKIVERCRGCRAA